MKLKPMSINDFCAKWGAKEITTPRMEGRRFLMPDGVTKFGYTNVWLVYAKKNTGIFHFMKRFKQQVCDEAYERLDDGDIKPGWRQREFELMLGQLDQFPRESMKSQLISGGQ